MAHTRIEPTAATANLDALQPAVEHRLAQLARENVVSRIWAKDHTVWKPEPTEIANRLEWLTVASAMRGHVSELAAFGEEIAREGITAVVLLGMGGSSLAPEVIRATLGRASGYPELNVLDSTDPRQIAAVEAAVDRADALFVVASKSGGTIETRSHFDYFWDKLSEPARYVAITDAGSALETLALGRGIRRIFLNPAGIGGRYSALSLFGLVPAALIGDDLGRLLDGAEAMMDACREEVVENNPGAWLGVVLGEAALAGRDKLTLVLPPEFASLGGWIEQLVAESTGKEGRGIVPIVGEALGGREHYGTDRIFVAMADDPGLAALEVAGHPVVRLPYASPYQLGAEFFRWEFATAIAGRVLGVQPFDQPNVQEAKEATAAILAGGRPDLTAPPLTDVLASVRPGDYIAITAYLPRDAETVASLDPLRLRLRDRYRVATTVGFGPRFLHSTGQLHKGGANTGVFIQLVSDDPADLPIPGQRFTFRQLRDAQADGDLAALTQHGRRVTRVRLEELRSALE